MASQTNKPANKDEKKSEIVQKPKRGIKNPFVYGGTIVILIITVVAFVFIPSFGGSLSGGSNAPTFGSWNGKSITYTPSSYFANQIQQINDYLRQQGVSEQNFQQYAYQVWRLAFQSTMIRTAAIDTVTKAGYRVTEKGLDEAITENSQFQKDGKFSLELYNSTPLATRISIRNTTKNDLLARRYYEDVYTISPSTQEIAFVAAMGKPQRSISYASIALADYPQSDLVAWGIKNAKLFRTFGVSRITITSSEADARKVLQQINDNKLSFEDAAKSQSKDAYADKGGDAGVIPFYVFSNGFSKPADAELVANLKKGQVSNVYKIADKAWAIFKINSEIKDPDFAKPEVISEVRTYMFDKEHGTLEAWAIAKANAIISSDSLTAFKSAAKKAGLPVKDAGPFIIDIGNPTFYAYNQQIPLLQQPNTNNDPTITSAMQDEPFMTQMFSLGVGKISKPLVVGDNVIIFGVTSAKEASDKELSIVKFAYPYFEQQTLDTQIRDAFLGSKKFKDNFNPTFAKLFVQKPNTQTSSSQSSSTTVAAPTSTTVSGK
jgi:parvulin-like peptidyl-prolyl isomerase